MRFVQEYARFENIESFEGNSMNDTFKNAKNESYTITVPSNFDKVQDSSPEIDLERGEEAPF